MDAHEFGAMGSIHLETSILYSELCGRRKLRIFRMHFFLLALFTHRILNTAAATATPAALWYAFKAHT